MPKIVVGLGNPGKKYEGTRHNVGFELIAELSRRHSASKPKLKFEAEIAEAAFGTEKLLLVMPQTFMNASGRSIRQIVDFFQVPIDSLLVVCDDINLPLGSIRLRRSGSSGGQKGLENTIQQLGTQEFSRLRIGVDAPGGQDTADYVLGRYGKREAPLIDTAIGTAAKAVEMWIERGIAAAMNTFNANPKPSQPPASGSE